MKILIAVLLIYAFVWFIIIRFSNEKEKSFKMSEFDDETAEELNDEINKQLYKRDIRY